ncbi:hypothetical protein [Thalassovita sp.]|jgi:hypothetical protein|uniref:hypothetical protein n=1 Tax=Thalassovita sp. TaxID=1979401 RepID=UPI003B5AB13E
MADYLIRYRNLSGSDPMSPLSERISATSEQQAIAQLKARLPQQEIRVETVRSDTPAPKKRKTWAQWVLLALFLVIGGVNVASRWLN